jgi:hypothetical protein
LIGSALKYLIDSKHMRIEIYEASIHSWELVIKGSPHHRDSIEEFLAGEDTASGGTIAIKCTSTIKSPRVFLLYS